MAGEDCPYNLQVFYINPDNRRFYNRSISWKNQWNSKLSSTHWMHWIIHSLQTQGRDYCGSLMLCNGFMQCFYQKTVDREGKTDVLKNRLDQSERRSIARAAYRLWTLEFKEKFRLLWVAFVELFKRWGDMLMEGSSNGLRCSISGNNQYQPKHLNQVQLKFIETVVICIFFNLHFTFNIPLLNSIKTKCSNFFGLITFFWISWQFTRPLVNDLFEIEEGCSCF